MQLVSFCIQVFLSLKRLCQFFCFYTLFVSTLPRLPDSCPLGNASTLLSMDQRWISGLLKREHLSGIDAKEESLTVCMYCGMAWYRFFGVLVCSLKIKLRCSWLTVPDFVLEGFLSVQLHFAHGRGLVSIQILLHKSSSVHGCEMACAER